MRQGGKDVAVDGAALAQRRRARLCALACTAALAALASFAGPARAAIGVGVESFSFEAVDLAGDPANQAGAHANLEVSAVLEDPGEPETAKNLVIGAPTGLFLYPDAAPRCAASTFGETSCTPSTQVGLVTVRANHESDPDFLLGTAPVYMLAPGPGEFLSLGFVIPTVGFPVRVPVTVRAGSDYGLDLTISNLSQPMPLASLDLGLWAVPADPAHDSQRFPAGSPGSPPGCPEAEGTGCIGGSVAVNTPEAPLTRTPTACTGPLAARLDANSWQEPGTFSTSMSVGPGTSGCGIVAFDPIQTAGLTTTAAETETGFDLRIQTTGETNPSGISWSDTKAISIALPPGLTIDEDTANAQPACTLAQAHLGIDGPVECPVDSEVGTFTVGVLGLADPLAGTVYFGGAESPDAHRLFLIASGSGVEARRLALVGPDLDTGLETLTLADLPQFPLDDLQLSVAEEPGLFLTPAECGDYEIRGEVAPWNDPSTPFVLANQVTIDSGFEGGPCIGPPDDVVVALDPPSIAADGESVEPEVLGAAELTQTAAPVHPVDPGPVADPASPIVLPADPPPTVTFRKRPPHRTHDRTPTVRFNSSEPDSAFSCSIDRRPPRPCGSPLTLPRLAFGPHTFRVSATDPAGNVSNLASCRFVVEPARRRR